MGIFFFEEIFFGWRFGCLVKGFGKRSNFDGFS